MANSHERQSDELRIRELRQNLREARAAIEVQRKDAQERLSDIETCFANVQQQENMLDQLTRAYEARQAVPSTRASVPGGNLREVLIINFTDSSGLIIGLEAISKLVEVEYFANREQADGAVYTVLGKPPFVWIHKGVYQVPVDSDEWIRLRGSNGHQVSPELSPPLTEQSPVSIGETSRHQLGLGVEVTSAAPTRPKPTRPKKKHSATKIVKSGVIDRVASILSEHPNWDRHTVADYLIRAAWDFRGKNPYFAVGMAFANLKKKAKAEPMPSRRGSQSQPQR